MKKKILIIEDEVEIAQLLIRRLENPLYKISHEMDGAKALCLIQNERFDLAYIDVMLPSVDGLTLTEALRRQDKDSIILIVSALSADSDQLKAYNLGADDYVSKPFSPKLLATKIASLLSRRDEIAPKTQSLPKGIDYDEMAKSISIKEQQLPLTPSEYHIFLLLLQLPRKVFSREEITQELYDNYDYDIDARGIDTHIYQIRKKIALLSDALVIKTVRNMGYTIYEN